MDQIEQIVEKKSGWIRSAIQRNFELQSRFRPRRYASGEKFLYLGEKYTLKVEPGRGSVAILPDNLLLVHVPAELAAEDQQACVAARLRAWYKVRASEKLAERVEEYAKLLHVKPGIVRVRELKSRWGSCSGRGNISLSWKLIMAPPPILDYVVAHELCHLIHLDHSPRFWSLLESIIPDSKARRQWMKENECSLVP